MKQKDHLLIGLFGTIGAGKTTVSDYLVKKKGFTRVIMGDLVRQKAKAEGLELTRENLGKTQEKYRSKYGKDYFINFAIRRLKDSKKEKLLVDGIRLPVDAEVAKEANAIFVLIDAPAKVRFARLKSRKRTGDPKTLNEFKKQEEREWKTFNFKKTLKYVDYTIDNSGTPKETLKKVDELLKQLKAEKNKK